MPEKRTKERAARAKRRGKAPTTQAGEFVREEVRKIRRGEHGARSPQQAVAVGLSKARRAGVDLPPPEKGKAKPRTRKSAEHAYETGQKKRTPRSSPRRSRAAKSALKREPRSTASSEALSRQSRKAAAQRSPEERSRAAKKAARTKGPATRSAAAKKAARTKGAAGRSAAARKAARTRAQRGTAGRRATTGRSTTSRRRTTTARRTRAGSR